MLAIITPITSYACWRITGVLLHVCLASLRSSAVLAACFDRAAAISVIHFTSGGFARIAARLAWPPMPDGKSESFPTSALVLLIEEEVELLPLELPVQNC